MSVLHNTQNNTQVYQYYTTHKYVVPVGSNTRSFLTKNLHKFGELQSTNK